MRRINLEEIRHDGKESRKFAYLHGDAENPRPRIHQLEHFADHISGSNMLEAVVVSLKKFEEFRSEYKKALAEDGELTKARRHELEELAYAEEFVPNKKGMLLFYHPQVNEIRAREVHPPDVG